MVGSEIISSQEWFCSSTVILMTSVGTVTFVVAKHKVFPSRRNCSIGKFVILLCWALCSASQQVAGKCPCVGRRVGWQQSSSGPCSSALT